MRMALYCCVFLLLLVCLAPRVGQNQTHNPKVARSNRAPATTGAARPNLKAPFFLSVAENTMLPPSSVNCRVTDFVPSWEQVGEQIAVNRPFYRDSSFSFSFHRSMRVHVCGHVHS